MYRLHEADEPTPWERSPLLPELARYVGADADEFLRFLYGREPSFGIIRCNGCGRWQDFPPPLTFKAMRAKAREAGWRRDGPDDLCPRCIT
jgi:hypothetical protein